MPSASPTGRHSAAALPVQPQVSGIIFISIIILFDCAMNDPYTSATICHFKLLSSLVCVYASQPGDHPCTSRHHVCAGAATAGQWQPAGSRLARQRGSKDPPSCSGPEQVCRARAQRGSSAACTITGCTSQCCCTWPAQDSSSHRSDQCCWHQPCVYATCVRAAQERRRCWRWTLSGAWRTAARPAESAGTQTSAASLHCTPQLHNCCMLRGCCPNSSDCSYRWVCTAETMRDMHAHARHLP